MTETQNIEPIRSLGGLLATMVELAKEDEAAGNALEIVRNYARNRQPGGWVKVEDFEVPESQDRVGVLCWVVGGGVQKGVVIFLPDGSREVVVDGFHGDFTVTHLQPLPNGPA